MEFFTFVSEQWLLVSLLLVLLYLYAWNEKRKSGSSLSIHTATRMINDGSAVVVDVRDSKEFKQGHIVDAINIPYNQIEDKAGQLASHQEKTLVLVDKIGQHVGSAGRLLRAKGYKVSRLEGGMAEWQNQNLPVVKK
ncbi:MAG: rhodanese-like domain-containing protein [Gammaproteobacteria bacterium]|uniref:rhodanese-like domain-containing protein n=1 Tax=Pseudomaricurvus alcaniphilus TaxID=1166482 RepID=UPI00140A3A2B|nr:rhodanese-like domain-containing protein [Gammaproteobacteria bacterium]NHN38682.1 rhodanese-like domain-containing protein [Pseudomaricurvus alcaniphilus]